MSAVTSRVPAVEASGGKDGVLAEVFMKSLTTRPQLRKLALLSGNKTLAPFCHNLLVIFAHASEKLMLIKGENCMTMKKTEAKVTVMLKEVGGPLHFLTTGGQIMSF